MNKKIIACFQKILSYEKQNLNVANAEPPTIQMNRWHTDKHKSPLSIYDDSLSCGDIPPSSWRNLSHDCL